MGQEKSNDASSSKKVMKNILKRLADINKQNNDELEINVTEETQKSPEQSPKTIDNEDNEQENELLNESPAKRIKLDKPENETETDNRRLTNDESKDDFDPPKSSE